MLAVKRMIDEGDRDVYDQIREQDYELYLNKGPAIQRDLARQLEKNARCDLIAHGDLWGWQKGVVHLATQTQPDDRHIDWHVDEAGGKV
jgi:calcineurin-like phosphoesterase family protein